MPGKRERECELFEKECSYCCKPIDTRECANMGDMEWNSTWMWEHLNWEPASERMQDTARGACENKPEIHPRCWEYSMRAEHGENRRDTLEKRAQDVAVISVRGVAQGKSHCSRLAYK